MTLKLFLTFLSLFVFSAGFCATEEDASATGRPLKVVFKVIPQVEVSHSSKSGYTVNPPFQNGSFPKSSRVRMQFGFFQTGKEEAVYGVRSWLDLSLSKASTRQDTGIKCPTAGDMLEMWVSVFDDDTMLVGKTFSIKTKDITDAVVNLSLIETEAHPGAQDHQKFTKWHLSVER